MNPPKKYSTQHQTEQQQEVDAAREQQLQQSAAGAREFASAEEMIRHDALHTPVPPAIGARLAESVKDLPAAKNPWWRRLLGKPK